jgi:hypothetical protein
MENEERSPVFETQAKTAAYTAANRANKIRRDYIQKVANKIVKSVSS